MSLPRNRLFDLAPGLQEQARAGTTQSTASNVLWT